MGGRKRRLWAFLFCLTALVIVTVGQFSRITPRLLDDVGGLMIVSVLGLAVATAVALYRLLRHR
jgi:hypothetical protein